MFYHGAIPERTKQSHQRGGFAKMSFFVKKICDIIYARKCGEAPHDRQTVVCLFYCIGGLYVYRKRHEHSPSGWRYIHSTDRADKLYVKNGSTWQEVAKAYKKVGGAWVEQDITQVFASSKKYIRG